MNIMSVIKGLSKCHDKVFLSLLRHLKACGRIFLFSLLVNFSNGLVFLDIVQNVQNFKMTWWYKFYHPRFHFISLAWTNNFGNVLWLPYYCFCSPVQFTSNTSIVYFMRSRKFYISFRVNLIHVLDFLMLKGLSHSPNPTNYIYFPIFLMFLIKDRTIFLPVCPVGCGIPLLYLAYRSTTRRKRL